MVAGVGASQADSPSGNGKDCKTREGLEGSAGQEGGSSQASE